jgi:HPt (histidine-containing phosphotransfer) domain-containing protein
VSFDDGVPARPRAAAATALLPRFLEHRRRDAAIIRTALESRDFETIGRLGHNMSGHGVSYGFPEISAIGKCLEAEAIAGNAIALREHLASLDACLAHVGAEGADETGTRMESSARVRVLTGDAETISRKTEKR